MVENKVQSIEEAIGQKKAFEQISEKSLVNIIYTQGWLREQLRQYFSNYDITLKQYNILRILRGANEPLTTSQIRDRMIDKMSDTTRLIDRMIKKGWVRKTTCLYDKRLVDIKITDMGLDLLEAIKGLDQKANDLFSGLDNEELKQLNALLDKVRS